MKNSTSHLNKYRYHYFYKITNLLDPRYYYYGIHSTNDLEDGYMGSGVRLKKEYEKIGIENFKKEIVKTFSSRRLASNYEKKMVTQKDVENQFCYNCLEGGDDAYYRDKEINDIKNNKGIWFPILLWEDQSLSFVEKGLIVKIYYISGKNKDSCFMSNETLAEFFLCSKATITNSISKLKKLDLIKQERFDGRKRFLKLTQTTLKYFE